jgi:hypothetical protein
MSLAKQLSRVLEKLDAKKPPAAPREKRPNRAAGTNPRRVADAPPLKPNAAFVLPGQLRIPDVVATQLRLAVAQARSGGETWESLEARTQVSHQQLVNVMKGARRMTAPVAFRLATAFGFELQLSIEKRAKRAA